MSRNVGRRLGVVIAVIVLLSALAAPAASASGPLIHVVQRGETLSLIAVRYGTTAYAIAWANGISDVNRIYAGQRLVIPDGWTQPRPEGCIHWVRWGDTLGGIARLYGVDVWALARANGIYNLNRIYPGQRLVIPGCWSQPPQPQPQPPQPQPPQPPHPQPPQPPQPPIPGPVGGWNAQYFNSRDLSGPVAYGCTEPNLDFNWGWGSPALQVTPDNFSARWTRTFYMNAGLYRITARVDDGIRVYIDGVLVIDSWTIQAVKTYQQDVQIMATGNHTFTVEYFEAEGVAEVHLYSQKL